MDEAPSSINYTTDLKIHKVISSMVATNTIMAHRLQTITDFDKVLVLDHGQVKQFNHLESTSILTRTFQGYV